VQAPDERLTAEIAMGFGSLHRQWLGWCHRISARLVSPVLPPRPPRLRV